MALLIGALLALGVAGFAAAVGFDRARAFYPVVMVVIASYYVLFAVMAGAGAALGLEIALFGLFAAAAVLGFRKNLWLVVVALVAHGVLDLFHAGLVANPGVPDWWPAFCLAYDVLAGACLAVLLLPATRPHVAIELQAAAVEQDGGRMEAAFRRLERAHILGQRSTIEHVRVHWLMLRWSCRQRDVREGLGQLFRLIGAAVATPFGLIPIGNTGGSNVSPFRPMEVPADLASVMTAVRKRRLRALLAATLSAGTMFGAHASAATQEVRLATVDGRNVAYRVLGQGKPVVVLISGLGDGMKSFDQVAPELAKSATVIVYDRAGYGGSTAADGVRDAAAVERELTGLLKATGIPGPYIIGGHSVGGLYAEYFAARNPRDTAGLILVDSRPAGFTRQCEAAGLKMCVATSAMMPFAPKGAHQEVAALEVTAEQVTLLSPGTMPVLVISRWSGSDSSARDALWSSAQRALASRYPRVRQLVAPGGGHYIHKQQRPWFVTSVRDFIQSLP